MSHVLLFEIGAEEIPPSYVPQALDQLERGARAGLEELRLAFEDVQVYGTPRRLALMVRGLAGRQTDRDEEVTGPSAKAAFDAAGQPTKALLGFCQGRGVDPALVRRVQTPKGEYVAVTVHHVGKPAAEVLRPLLTRLATTIGFPKTMRWLADDTRFARPVRWLVALLDDQVLPVRAFGVDAGRESQGHRFLARGAVSLRQAREYLGALEKAFVLADPTERSARIRSQAETLAREAGGRIRDDEELLAINAFLAEWPTALRGAFDERYMKLPVEVIVMALREHQRFFAVERPLTGPTRPELLPSFIAVRDGDSRGLDQVRRGNEEVLVARLDDAEFYWQTDQKRTLEQWVESLGSVVWMEGLGSLRDKAARLESLTDWLADRLNPSAKTAARRAALLCKTDLTSEMIGSGKEYASLQGVIGAYYAKHAGEPEEVRFAIYDHYRPAFANDVLPTTDAGLILSLADKLDHVAGSFIAGKVPKGSEDPYGVRRAGNGVIRILMEKDRSLDLYAASMESTRILFANDPELPHAAIMKQLGAFWRGRVESALDDRSIAYDERDAAVEARVAGSEVGRPGWTDPADCLSRARELRGFRADARFESLVILFKRVANILKAATEPLPASLDRAALVEPAEQALHSALLRAREATDPLWARRAYRDILPALLDMERPIHTFFDVVLVNAEEARIRLNRLRLLDEVRALFLRGWDLSRVVVEGERVPVSAGR